MPLKPVDTAIVVSVGPLIDDSDFKALETAIAYNESGMSVDLFVESADGVTKTDITPTTGSTQDWTHKGNGVYELEITAAQNATEGTLWVVGVCDGVLPFESPRYTIVPTAVYNSLVAGSDTLQADVTQIGGVAQRATDLAEIAQYLFANSATLTDIIADSSVLAQLLAVGGDISDYNNATDALEALRDRGDAAWATASGFATAAKLLAYVQLLARSDAAIATDNATELGEINADGGSGAGDFANQTDAHEAVRDWIGNGTNLTEAGGTGDQFSALPAVTLANGAHGGAAATITLAGYDNFKATGFSTHAASDVVTALGTGSTLTDCATATGFSTHSAADVVTALGTGETLTACLTATGFNTVIPDVAGTAATLIGALQTHGDSEWATAVGFNTVTPDAAGTAATLIGGLQTHGDSTWATATGFAVAGDAMQLADGAITAAKFDGSTAHPLKSADTGATAIARTGADGDTLETLSDEIAGVTAPTAAAVADAVWDEATSGHTTAGTFGYNLDAQVSEVGGTTGSGADTVTLTINDDDGDPIADADVWVSSDAGGSTVVAGTRQTNSSGEVTFYLDAGETYYCWRQKDGITFSNPQSFTATADA